MALLGDRVQETTTTTGTGSLTLNGAVTGYVTFNSTFSNGDIVWYVVDDGAGNWEIGSGTVGTGTLTRSVFQSSNANALVPFSAGTKRVFCSAPYTYFLPDQTGNSGKFLTTDGSIPSWSTNPLGTVTTVSVVSANGLAGTVANATTTPAITLSTSVTGVLKGNGTAISAAVAGTDYAGLASANTFTNDQVISVNSSSDALRITQTGAGNALLVEDSANPDSTPFVVNSVGQSIIGAAQNYNIVGGRTPLLSLHGYDYAYGAFGVNRWSADNQGFYVGLNKSRGTTAGTHTVVLNNDGLGVVEFSGSDGTSFIPAAAINVYVDGTPGTNDMPGRLVFSTTADGASSPTERMRIDSAGRVGIGGTSYAGNTLNIQKALTGATTAQQVNVGFTINSDVTSSAVVVASYPATQAAAFTLSNLKHFSAAQGTIGAGSAVTNQYGFNADSGLTGATNNYGFHSNIASGTGRWNFYAAGTAANYFAGTVTVNALIESTLNGFKFPDGTTQTTAATPGISTGKAIAMAMIFGG